ncbi:MAG: hypothetical protein AAFX62_02925 [Pseudomonadota bacterium]
MSRFWDKILTPQMLKRIATGAVALFAFLVLIDPLIPKHGYFEIEETPSFGGLFGLAATAALVVVGLVLGAVFSRRRYDDE